MSGWNLFNRVRRIRQNNERRDQRDKAKASCNDKSMSLRLLVNTAQNVKTKTDGDKNNVTSKYFCKGSPSITQEIDYQFEVAAKGNLQEFQRLYEADDSRINIQDSKGLTPAHKAAENGKANILDFIINHGGDINQVDNHGNTPLHLAVAGEHCESIDLLLNHGADSSILNEDQLAPIHAAVETNAVKSLTALLKHESVNPNLFGEKCCTSLHYCAFKDRDECAILLLKNGARPCIKNANGFFPINIAAKCASAKTLEVLIRHVEALGYTREDVLTFSDKENNMPLHCAVNSGDLKVWQPSSVQSNFNGSNTFGTMKISSRQGEFDPMRVHNSARSGGIIRSSLSFYNMKAVRVCLNAGAPLDAKQEDKSTPLHFACAQGSVDMVQMMHDMQPERFETALQTEDILKMRPLHRAALFDHVAVVEYLVKLNTDVNIQDIHDRTPLLLAASKGGWRTVHYLLQNGADITIKDKENRNFLHLAIKYGSHIDKFGCEVLKGVKNLLNERDDFGCTPLHYASKEGHLVAIDDLLKLGATVNPKDNEKKSPLHFAAKYGRYNTCKRLLESIMGPNIINETDGEGLSALHYAAQEGHTKIITLLMHKGAYLTKDDQDNSPLHLAAANGYTRSMRLLLTLYPNLLDLHNKAGDTALHVATRAGHATAVELLMCIGAKFTKNTDKLTFIDIAIQEKYTEVGLAIVRHPRWEEALNLCSKLYITPMNGLVQFLPEVSMAALDRCITTANTDSKKKDFYTMVRHGRVQCLSHPLSEAFLNMKWRAYGSWFHITNLVIYAIFLALLTVLVTTCTFRFAQADSAAVSTNSTNTTTLLPANTTDTLSVQRCEFKTIHRLSVFIVLIFCCLNMLKEIVQLVQQRSKYFLDMTNYLEWVLYVSTMLYILPFLTRTNHVWQWQAGAIAVFLAWFNCLLFLRRFDFFGIYVVMFLEILHTLLQVLCVFSILMIAFGMAFFMLMNKEATGAHSTVGLSLLRTAMMMLELDFMESFNEPYTDNDPHTLYFGGTVIFLLVCFVLLMPILLMNLLIGLAVGDITSVQKHATLKRLAMQVELHTDLERKLPWRILDMVDKTEYKHYPNKCSGYVTMFWSKISFTGDTFDSDSDPTLNHQNHLYEELYKQKQRMKDLSSNMSKQYELIRLIVQKMEIHTEDDNKDEGVEYDTSDLMKTEKTKWSPVVRKNLVRQSAVVAAWKSSMDKAV